MTKLTDSELEQFATMTDAYNILNRCIGDLEQQAEQFKVDFQTSGDIDNEWLHNPLDVDYDLRDLPDKLKEKITSFIYTYMQKKHTNLVIDHNDLMKFIGVRSPGYDDENRPVLQGPFTALKVIRYIEKKYADVEGITLRQLKSYARNALTREQDYPYEKITDPKLITVINKTGIELRDHLYNKYSNEDPSAAIIKLIHIKLSDILPSEAEHHAIDIGYTYSDDKIKSLRRFKNSKLKITFFNEDDMEVVREMLVEEPPA